MPGGARSGVTGEKAQSLLVADVVNAVPVDAAAEAGGAAASALGGSVLMASGLILSATLPPPADAEEPPPAGGGSHAPHAIPLTKLMGLWMTLFHGFLGVLPLGSASLVGLLACLFSTKVAMSLLVLPFLLVLPVIFTAVLYRSAAVQFRLVCESAWAEGSLTEQVYESGQRYLHYSYTAQTTRRPDGITETDTVIPDTVQTQLSSSSPVPFRVLVVYDPSHSPRVRAREACVIFDVVLDANGGLQLQRDWTFWAVFLRVALSLGTSLLMSAMVVVTIVYARSLSANGPAMG
jgi:hypothetical protein|eukprot:COSAG06_NODE_2087_length_7623_cov_4.460659_3_plen_292_part_00